MKWNDVATWNFQIITKSWHNISTWVFNIITKNWHNVALWNLNLIVKGWHDVAHWIFILGMPTVIIPFLFIGLCFFLGIVFLALKLTHSK